MPAAWTSTNAVASPAEITMLTAGTPRPESRPNTGGNRPSRAAAIGTWPMSSVQPLSAPMEEMSTASETAPAPTEPHMMRAASGALQILLAHAS